MEEDIKRAISSCRIWEELRDEAEQHAELYVSTTMGLSDEDESKQTIKSQYIDMFMEEIRKII